MMLIQLNASQNLLRPRTEQVFFSTSSGIVSNQFLPAQAYVTEAEACTSKGLVRTASENR